MRIAASTRWLLVAAAAVAVRADDSETRAGVVAAPSSNIAVSALTVTAPFTFNTPSPSPFQFVPTTPSSSTAAPTTAPSTPTTAPSTPTTAPSSSAAPATSVKPSATPSTNLRPSTSPTTSGSMANGGTTPTVGAPVTCAFRFSMPAASNLASELSRLAQSQTSQKQKNDSSSTPSGASNSTASTTDGTTTPGGATTPSNSTSQTTTGSGAMDVTVPPDTTMTPATTTTPSTPSTTTKTPSTTTKAPTAPAVTTKTPALTTSAPSLTSKPPSSGSTDGRRLQLAADTGMTPSPAPTPTTNKPPTTTSAPTTTTRAPTAPMTTTAPASTNGSAATLAPTTTTSSDSSGAGAPSQAPVTLAPSAAQSSSSLSGPTVSVPTTTTVVTGEFACDATFYGAWAHLGLTCGGSPLDVQAAAAQSQCLIYAGVQTAVVELKMCLSLCKIPKCTADGVWDYAAEDGLSSPVYEKFDFAELAKYLGKQQLLGSAASSAFSSLTLKSDRTCAYESESSFGTCQCENLLVDGTAGSSSSKATKAPAALMPVVDKGLGDANHWGDGVAKTAIDKVSIASAAIGSSAAAVSVAAGAVMSVAGGVMSTGAGVAGGVSATASLGLAMVAVDICQFSVMVNQMNLDATPRLLQEMGKRMAPSTFSFLPFGKVDNVTATNGTVVSRRLMDVTNTNQTLGMERYAALIGVKVDMLFYLTLAGVMMMCVAPFVLCALLVLVASPFVEDVRAFAAKWFDKTVGVLMMILILSEYVVGVTATFQICYLIKYNKPTDAGMFLAIFSLIFFAVGTILYGMWVVKHHEDDLRDLGTKDHFEKPVHARYGPLYDEYKFEGRYFFAPKLMLALLCGATTGFIGMPGIWQVCVLITLHIAFLLYMEVKRPYPTAFVQKTSSFVIIIKISALFLTLFLISSATQLQKDIPVDLREGVGFAIIGLQVLVLVCLMVRQMYIFYVTWKLKREDDEKREQDEQNQQQSSRESFQPLGGDINNPHHQYNQNHQQQYNQHQQPNQYNQYGHVPIMDGGRVSTPLQPQYGGQQTPKLRGLQPAPLPAQGGMHGNGMRRTHTVVVHDEPTNSFRRPAGNEITF